MCTRGLWRLSATPSRQWEQAQRRAARSQALAVALRRQLNLTRPQRATGLVNRRWVGVRVGPMPHTQSQAVSASQVAAERCVVYSVDGLAAAFSLPCVCVLQAEVIPGLSAEEISAAAVAADGRAGQEMQCAAVGDEDDDGQEADTPVRTRTLTVRKIMADVVVKESRNKKHAHFMRQRDILPGAQPDGRSPAKQSLVSPSPAASSPVRLAHAPHAKSLACCVYVRGLVVFSSRSTSGNGAQLRHVTAAFACCGHLFVWGPSVYLCVCANRVGLSLCTGCAYG